MKRVIAKGLVIVMMLTSFTGGGLSLCGLDRADSAQLQEINEQLKFLVEIAKKWEERFNSEQMANCRVNMERES